ncbi:hypothetical protein A3A93_00570 [Candidatus Roizmanbacteria bacterium RIFCSPLOWO2_01_FULL_38_12]|uniref:Nudix hydrolase domain-containing protein n=1 Tax=Candidatus Roizmanbacteria bacterium RIFCSPLOWO2_01_FULL_38_12 TaxID=1802061 RepID=A0A1F7J056_9BACT|nr:MAG: hypothetical protein A2861_00005 [Candidatus Roizmanbacteria bacterium RIFCSPHIGHO2_01_FULL_38_15]OGK36082.1 MAG: hypothetical protein A3F59_01245 [Candidatus Roizmanbacteria bacterium RIFCSPHIGHO2_12_FULL_38_13]OGK48994.1 MAG: hypothetical protein A3A93_00570 [Candidatus Roizmanbacteria bacterium RIFCSPLOWO2_01_FULL_38_12]
MQKKSVIETSAGGVVFKFVEDVRHWLVIQHNKAKHWGFPKGHVGDKVDNESLEDAALREVKEEGGITAKIIDHKPFRNTYFYTLNGFPRKKTVYYFLMEYVSGDTKDHDWEVQEAKFVPEDDIFDVLTYKNDKKILEKVIEKLKK